LPSEIAVQGEVRPAKATTPGQFRNGLQATAAAQAGNEAITLLR